MVSPSTQSVIIIFTNFFRWVFSEYTEAVTATLIPIDAILHEICAFIVGFNCTVWTKMRSLQAPLAVIMNKSQEMTDFHGRQKLTSAMKLRLEK